MIGTMTIDVDINSNNNETIPLISKALMNRFVSILDEFSLKEKEVINEIISKTIKENQKRQSNSNNCSEEEEEENSNKWYQIKGFSKDLNHKICEFWNNDLNLNEYKNLKQLVKKITKLCYIYERTQQFFDNNILDSYKFLNLEFSEIDSEKLIKIQKKDFKRK